MERGEPCKSVVDGKNGVERVRAKNGKQPNGLELKATATIPAIKTIPNINIFITK